MMAYTVIQIGERSLRRLHDLRGVFLLQMDRHPSVGGEVIGSGSQVYQVGHIF